MFYISYNNFTKRDGPATLSPGEGFLDATRRALVAMPPTVDGGQR